jgi:hypothetical protein
MTLFDEYQSKGNAKHTLRATLPSFSPRRIQIGAHASNDGSRPPFYPCSALRNSLMKSCAT